MPRRTSKKTDDPRPPIDIAAVLKDHVTIEQHILRLLRDHPGMYISDVEDELLTSLAAGTELPTDDAERVRSKIQERFQLLRGALALEVVEGPAGDCAYLPSAQTVLVHLFPKDLVAEGEVEDLLAELLSAWVVRGNDLREEDAKLLEERGALAVVRARLPGAFQAGQLATVNGQVGKNNARIEEAAVAAQDEQDAPQDGGASEGAAPADAPTADPVGAMLLKLLDNNPRGFAAVAVLPLLPLVDGKPVSLDVVVQRLDALASGDAPRARRIEEDGGEVRYQPITAPAQGTWAQAVEACQKQAASEVHKLGPDRVRFKRRRQVTHAELDERVGAHLDALKTIDRIEEERKSANKSFNEAREQAEARERDLRAEVELARTGTVEVEVWARAEIRGSTVYLFDAETNELLQERAATPEELQMTLPGHENVGTKPDAAAGGKKAKKSGRKRGGDADQPPAG